MTLKVTVTLDEDVIVTFEVTLTKSIRSPRTIFKMLALLDWFDLGFSLQFQGRETYLLDIKPIKNQDV